MDQSLFVAVYDAFVERLQAAGLELRTSTLKDGVWTTVVSPRPLLTIRTTYDGHTRRLTIAARRVWPYRPLYETDVRHTNVDSVVKQAVAMHRGVGHPPSHAGSQAQS